MIFERCHHRPVHFSTLDARALNAVLAQWVLSRIITIKMESANLLNILKVSVVMSLSVGGSDACAADQCMASVGSCYAGGWSVCGFGIGF